MPLNWIDWIIIVVVGYQTFRGWEAGIVSLGSSFISFAVSLWLAISYHGPVAAFLTEKFGITTSWSLVLGYVIVALLSEMAIAELLFILSKRLPNKLLNSKLNSWFGAFLSGVNGILVFTFFLLIIIALPLRGTIKSDIQKSTIGGWLVRAAERYGGPIKSEMEQIRKEAIKFLTIAPSSKENITIDVAPKPSDLKIDESAENQMVIFVNAERTRAGLSPVTADSSIVQVARAQSRDMFTRRYFSHYSPEGKDAGDRLKEGGVTFVVAGENLAYAPDVKTAHEGLMNSPEHKKNILEPQFHHIGIGIISTESFGIMVTQNFTD